MSNALLDFFFDQQKTAVSESLSAWERMINAATLPQKAANAFTSYSPHEVVFEENSLQLLRFKNDSVDLAEPVLICFALVNRPYILDLDQQRSVVQQFVRHGFDVYLIDWGVPSDSDRTLRLHDYIEGYLANCVDQVCQLSGSEQLNLLGYCMGGTMSSIYASLYPKRIRNLILMAAPIDFSSNKGLINLWTREENFDVDGFIDAFGNCPGSFLQSSFQLRDPIQNFFWKYQSFYERMHDESYLDNFFSMENWSNDNIPVAGETFREFVKCFYQGNQLALGKFRLYGKPVSLGEITCPLLTLVAEADDLVPIESTLAIEDCVSSKETASMSIDAGHIGLAVSSRAHRELWPKVTMWLADRSTVRRA